MVCYQNKGFFVNLFSCIYSQTENLEPTKPDPEAETKTALFLEKTLIAEFYDRILSALQGYLPRTGGWPKLNTTGIAPGFQSPQRPNECCWSVSGLGY